MKRVLAPVVVLGLPVLGVISDAHPPNCKWWLNCGWRAPHQICQFHTICEAGRFIYNADHWVKTDMRIRMRQKAHEYRQDIHKRLKEAEAKKAVCLILTECAQPVRVPLEKEKMGVSS